MMLLLFSLALATSEKDRALISQLDREVIALKQRIAILEQQKQACGNSSPPAIYTELVQIYSGGPIKVERQLQEVQVSFPADLLFAADSTRLREEALPMLDLLATALKLHAVEATVEGYADSEPMSSAIRKLWPTPWEWTAARSVAVVRALVDNFGLPAGRLLAAGRGASHPVSPSDTPEGRALNRRIVVVIRPML